MALLESLIAGSAAGFASGGMGFLGSLFGSGGTSNAQTIDLWDKMYGPTKAGWSRAQIENALAFQQYKKELESSAAASVKTSQQLNRLLPSAQVEGLELAGLNPILAILGQGFSPIQANVSAPSTPTSHSFDNTQKPSRHFSSAGSVESFYKVFNGLLDSQKEKTDAQTDTIDAQKDNLKAQNHNLNAQNDLIHAQADKTRAESERIRDTLKLGAGSTSDSIRLARTIGNIGNSVLGNMVKDDPSTARKIMNAIKFGSPLPASVADKVRDWLVGAFDDSPGTIELINHSASSESEKPAASKVYDDKSKSKPWYIKKIHTW